MIERDRILTLDKLTKLYGSVPVVDEVSLSLDRGEFLTLLGPSGSGKTTTLMMIAGLVAPSGGTMLLDGRLLNPIPPYQRNLGVVFQNYALFPHLSVARNVAFPLEMRGEKSAVVRQRVRDALSLVGLPNYDDRFPQQLSGGQQQRVALARAMVYQPRLLLMDEPLGALDKKLREQMQMELMRLHKSVGVSIIYVTHDQEEALVMSDRIAVFNQGKIDQIGLPSELYERPASRFVADFLGESNFFSGIVKELRSGFCRLNGGDLSFTGRTEGTLEIGQDAVLAVRPERIRLIAAASGIASTENQASGVVQNVIYLGRSRKYVVRVNDRLETVILQQAEASRSAFGIGERVQIAWRAEDCTAFPNRPEQSFGSAGPDGPRRLEPSD